MARQTNCEGHDTEGVHLLRLRWDQLAERDARLGAPHVARPLDRMAEAGTEEATAAPIGDG